MHKRGFTLIELLVVVAIIGILATLVITQLGSARVKARNSAAKSDVTEIGKSIEVYKADDNSGERVISTGTALSTATVAGPTAAAGEAIVTGTTDSSTASTAFTPFFSGTATYNAAAASTYGIKISKTPSTSYSYRYWAMPSTAVGGANTYGYMTGGCYYVYSNTDASSGVTDTSFAVVNGTSYNGTSNKDGGMRLTSCP